jgi:hypothetical protein
VPDASATEACALAELTREKIKTNTYTDTAYVFDVARIAVPKKSYPRCSTIMPCTNSRRVDDDYERRQMKGEVFAIAHHESL